MSEINSKIPQGPLAEKWTNYKNHQKLVNPANKRRLDVIVVGTGLVDFRRSIFGRDGIQRIELLYPRFSPPCALYRRSRWYQRR